MLTPRHPGSGPGYRRAEPSLAAGAGEARRRCCGAAGPPAEGGGRAVSKPARCSNTTHHGLVCVPLLKSVSPLSLLAAWLAAWPSAAPR